MCDAFVVRLLPLSRVPCTGCKRVHTCAGQPDTFSVVRRVLPGPYTFILSASKEMPKLLTGKGKGKQKKKQRHTVGVRMPDNAVCRELLEALERWAAASRHACLLHRHLFCHSGGTWIFRFTVPCVGCYLCELLECMLAFRTPWSALLVQFESGAIETRLSAVSSRRHLQAAALHQRACK